MPTWYKKGAWNAICDRCGQKFKSDELRKTWNGLYVCLRDYEPRHPQDFIRSRADKQSVPWTRPEPDDSGDVCYLWERSSYADLASADCGTADTTTYTYAYLLALREGNG